MIFSIDRSNSRAIRFASSQLTLASTKAAATGACTVTEMFAAYWRDVAQFSKGQGPKEVERRIKLWTHYLGADRDANSIDRAILGRYVRERRAGKVKVPGVKLAPKPSNRAIGADLVMLRAALNHATGVKREDGTPLMKANPVAKFPIPTNANVRRPVATYDRYLAVRAKADEVDPQGLFAPFLDLVEALGWRVTAICELRASDVDRAKHPHAPHGRLRKRAEHDKEGVDQWVPLSEDARSALDLIVERRPTVGEMPLFPSPKARTTHDKTERAAPKPWSRFHARALLGRAEKAAGLPPLEGSDFHAYRRKWASERKTMPAQDVAVAGGWKDLRCLQTAYTQADEATTYAVVSSTTKLRDAKPAEAAAGR